PCVPSPLDHGHVPVLGVEVRTAKSARRKFDTHHIDAAGLGRIASEHCDLDPDAKRVLPFELIRRVSYETLIVGLTRGWNSTGDGDADHAGHTDQVDEFHGQFLQ